MNKREIDMQIAEKIFGWETQEFKNINVISAFTEDGEELNIPKDFSPSENINDAFNVVDKFFRVDIETGNGANEHLATIRDEAGWTISYHYGKTIQLAICGAALKAKGVTTIERT